jgi:hypothetical protein
MLNVLSLERCVLVKNVAKNGEYLGGFEKGSSINDVTWDLAGWGVLDERHHLWKIPN